MIHVLAHALTTRLHYNRKKSDEDIHVDLKSTVTVTKFLHMYLRFNGQFPGDTGFGGSPLVLFLHQFWKNFLGINGTCFMGRMLFLSLNQ